jgi:hypothetical protein
MKPMADFLETVKKVAETIKVSAEAVAAARSPEFSPTGLHRVVSRKIGDRGRHATVKRWILTKSGSPTSTPKRESPNKSAVAGPT